MRKFVANPRAVPLGILPAPPCSALRATAAAIPNPASGSPAVARPIDPLGSGSTAPAIPLAAIFSDVMLVMAQGASESPEPAPIVVTVVTTTNAQNVEVTSKSEIAPVRSGASLTSDAGSLSRYILCIGPGFVSSGVRRAAAFSDGGTYLPKILTLNEVIDNVDIGSIQAFRSPPGMVYGRKATGLVFTIHNAHPIDKSETRARGGPEKFEHRLINDNVEISSADDLAVRVSRKFKHDSGFVQAAPRRQGQRRRSHLLHACQAAVAVLCCGDRASGQLVQHHQLI